MTPSVPPMTLKALRAAIKAVDPKARITGGPLPEFSFIVRTGELKLVRAQAAYLGLIESHKAEIEGSRWDWIHVLYLNLPEGRQQPLKPEPTPANPGADARIFLALLASYQGDPDLMLELTEACSPKENKAIRTMLDGMEGPADGALNRVIADLRKVAGLRPPKRAP